MRMHAMTFFMYLKSHRELHPMLAILLEMEEANKNSLVV